MHSVDELYIQREKAGKCRSGDSPRLPRTSVTIEFEASQRGRTHAVVGVLKRKRRRREMVKKKKRLKTAHSVQKSSRPFRDTCVCRACTTWQLPWATLFQPATRHPVRHKEVNNIYSQSTRSFPFIKRKLYKDKKAAARTTRTEGIPVAPMISITSGAPSNGILVQVAPIIYRTIISILALKYQNIFCS